MRTSIFLTVVVLFTSTLFVSAQEFQVPTNYTLEKEEDFIKYEKDIIDCIRWMEDTPLNQQTEKRKEASAFFIKWLIGAPQVSVEISSDIVNFADTNPMLLIIFMGGWTDMVLANPEYRQDRIKGNMAGLESVISFYKKGNGIKKDKNVDKYIKLQSKGELEKFVKEKVSTMDKMQKEKVEGGTEM